MRCQDIQTKFPDYLIGDIDSKTKKDLQSHIADCSTCREELESLSSIWAKLGVLPEERPSNDLRTRFYSMLEAQKHELEQQKARSRFRKIFPGRLEGWWPRRPAFQLSLSLLFLVFGLATGYFLSSKGQAPQELVQLRQEVQSMHQMLAVSLLDQQSPSDRIRGVNLSYGIEKPEPQTLTRLLRTLNSDPNVNVRLAAVDALYLFRDNAIVREGLVVSLSQQSSPLVQVALIDLIVDIRERQAIDALKQLIQDEELTPEVKQRAEQSIQQLSY